jgi:hypothetical protein
VAEVSGPQGLKVSKFNEVGKEINQLPVAE